MTLKKMIERNKYCWSCTKQFYVPSSERNCDTCKDEYRRKQLYQYCNNKSCQKLKELNNKPLCTDCYIKVRRLNEQETVAYNAMLIRTGRI